LEEIRLELDQAAESSVQHVAGELYPYLILRALGRDL
jgi:hypothetical protein